MKIKNPRHDCDNCHNNDTITIQTKIGRNAWVPTIEDLEKWIKEEIFLLKSCGCCHCNYRRDMLRKMQGVIRENEILKDKIKYMEKNCRYKKVCK